MGYLLIVQNMQQRRFKKDSTRLTLVNFPLSLVAFKQQLVNFEIVDNGLLELKNNPYTFPC